MFEKYHYSDLVAKFNSKKVFIGKSPGLGVGFKGNSFVIKLSNKKYAFIGHELYKFTTTDDIIDYASPVGNSDVPYPVAFGTENLYFMLDHAYVNRAHAPPGLTKKQRLDMYQFYSFEYNDSPKMEKYKNIMKNYTLIQKEL